MAHGYIKVHNFGFSVDTLFGRSKVETVKRASNDVQHIVCVITNRASEQEYCLKS